MLSKIEPSNFERLDTKGSPHMVHRLVITEKGSEVISFAENAATLKIKVDEIFAKVAAIGKWTKSLVAEAHQIRIPKIDVHKEFTAIPPDYWFSVIHGDISVANSSTKGPMLAKVRVSLALGASWQRYTKAPVNFAAWMAEKDKATIDHDSNYSSSYLYSGFLMTRAGEGKNRVQLYRNQFESDILTQLYIQDCAPPECMELKKSLWGNLWIVERKRKYIRRRLNPLPNEISHGKYLLLWPEYSLPILEAYGVKKSKWRFFCFNPHQVREEVLQKLGGKFFAG